VEVLVAEQTNAERKNGLTHLDLGGLFFRNQKSRLYENWNTDYEILTQWQVGSIAKGPKTSHAGTKR
jgi:hypothetical protein